MSFNFNPAVTSFHNLLDSFSFWSVMLRTTFLVTGIFKTSTNTSVFCKLVKISKISKIHAAMILNGRNYKEKKIGAILRDRSVGGLYPNKIFNSPEFLGQFPKPCRSGGKYFRFYNGWVPRKWENDSAYSCFDPFSFHDSIPFSRNRKKRFFICRRKYFSGYSVFFPSVKGFRVKFDVCVIAGLFARHRNSPTKFYPRSGQYRSANK